MPFPAWKSPTPAHSACSMPKSRPSSPVLCKTIQKTPQLSNKSSKLANISKMIRKTRGLKYCNNCSITAKCPHSTKSPLLNPRCKPSPSHRSLPHRRHPSRPQPSCQRREGSLSRASRRNQPPTPPHSSHCCPATPVPVQIPTPKLRRTRTKASLRCKAQYLSLRVARSLSHLTSSRRPRS